MIRILVLMLLICAANGQERKAVTDIYDNKNAEKTYESAARTLKLRLITLDKKYLETKARYEEDYRLQLKSAKLKAMAEQKLELAVKLDKEYKALQAKKKATLPQPKPVTMRPKAPTPTGKDPLIGPWHNEGNKYSMFLLENGNAFHSHGVKGTWRSVGGKVSIKWANGGSWDMSHSGNDLKFLDKNSKHHFRRIQ